MLKEIGNLCDDETRAVLNGIEFVSPAEQIQYAAYANLRKQLFAAGRAFVPDFWQRALAEFDPLLRLRVDYMQNAFVVDRWIERDQYWHTVLIFDAHWTLSEMYIAKVLNTLDAHNMQRYRDPQQYMRIKREAAARTRESNRKHSDDVVLTAVDSLSSKRLKEFTDAHYAIRSGEKITCHGADEKFLDRNYAATRAGLVPDIPRPDQALNPGMNPLIYERKPV